MTTIIQAANSYVGGVNPLAANGDIYYLPQGITVASPSDFGLYSTFSGTLTIDGNVFGPSSGIAIGSVGFDSYVTIGTSAHVTGNSSGEGMDVFGQHQIFNYGQIVCTGGSGYGVDTTGSGALYNYGNIAGGQYGIFNNDLVSIDIVTTFNAGSVTGGFFAYLGAGSIDQITNTATGIMTGNVSTFGGDDTLYNTGHIYGNIDMGSGNDTVYTHLNELGPYTLSGGAGTDTLANLDTGGSDIVNLTSMSFEKYYGGAGSDYVWAGGSTDSITFAGGAGNDGFTGGSGNDYMIGGSGADYLDGGAGVNAALYTGSLQGVNVNLLAGTASGGDATGDVLLNVQNLYGSDQADILTGDNGANTLVGGAGNDVLIGNGGNDLLIGGAGNDYLVGGAGNDIFYYNATGFGSDEITDFTIGQDTIYISTAVAASIANVTFTQSGSATVLGFGGGYVVLDNTLATNLHPSDFVFF